MGCIVIPVHYMFDLSREILLDKEIDLKKKKNSMAIVQLEKKQ